jgi:TRAP-type C4-dicarboxylate transport system substrate-binding protein
MKKEIITGCFLIAMLATALVNIHFLNKLTDNVTQLIEEAEKSAEQGEWERAATKAEEAADLWSGSDTYTHLVLRHPEVEAATDAIYGFMEQVYAGEEGAAKGAALAAISRLESISSIEQISFGSIF